jgi:peptidoglycan L-alanyl-D-glutamate endopeptidase CwlK
MATITNAAVKFAAQKVIEYSYKAGVEIRYTFGLRTFAEQDALYAQGRTRPGNIVTNAKAGHSNHNYGLALDFVLIKGGYDMKADDDHDGIADWLEVVAIAKLFGFEWGGDWITFKDNPHIEMTFGLSIKDLLAGKRPTDKQIGAVITKIQKWELEEKEMADVQLLVEKIEVQNDIITSMEKRLAAVEKRLNISGKETYADQYKEAVEAAKAAKIITTVADKSKIELNIIQMLYNAGVIPKIKK